MTSGVFLIDTECQFGAYSAKVKIWLKKYQDTIATELSLPCS